MNQVLAKDEPTVAWADALARLEERGRRPVTPRYRIELTRTRCALWRSWTSRCAVGSRAAIDRLADDPHPAGMIALRGAPGAFRIRIGDYRVIYVLHDDLLLVVVIDIGHRRDVYRNV